jgi:tetratricopeptide (TPR) repeat protein
MFYSKELEVEELRENKKGIARAYNNVGTVYAKQGKIDKALESFTRSIDIKDEIGDIKGKISTYDNIALVFDMLQEWEKAEEFYNLSYEIKARLNDVVGMADNLWRRAKLYHEQQQYEESLDLMAQTISLLESVQHPHLDKYRRAFNDLLRVVYTE